MLNQRTLFYQRNSFSLYWSNSRLLHLISWTITLHLSIDSVPTVFSTSVSTQCWRRMLKIQSTSSRRQGYLTKQTFPSRRMFMAVAAIQELKGDLIKINLHKIVNMPCRFWKQVRPEFIHQLNQDWSYKHDFKILGFSMEEYLDNL